MPYVTPKQCSTDELERVLAKTRKNYAPGAEYPDEIKKILDAIEAELKARRS